MKNIFFAINGKGITSEFIKENNGKIPAIQGGEDNNGILGFLSGEFKKTLVYINQPCLTLARVGTAGNIGFISDECYIGDKAKALIFKNTKLKYNIYCYLFLKTILLKLKYKYSYGRGIRIDRYLENEIMLPADQDGNPD
ncbi:restriction endonuclease subunit S [bacterium]|nr:restriction endonuclease subunit S [bacterium]